MQGKTAADFPPEVLQHFDGYVHGNLTRREFLEGAGRPAFESAPKANNVKYESRTLACFKQNLKG